MSAALEPSAPEVFRAIMAEAAVCRRIVIEDDWTGVDGREEVMEDSGADPETIHTWTRSFLSKNGLTKVDVGEIVVPSEDNVILVLCIARTQKSQSSPLKIALQVEFAQWARVILNTTEFREEPCDNCNGFPSGFYSCKGDQATVYVLANPGQGVNRVGIGIAPKLRRGRTCPVVPDTSADYGKQEVILSEIQKKRVQRL